MIPIRCPRCLTDGQAPASLERLLCPVCSTVMRRADCPACGQRHIIDEAATEATCPTTGSRLVVSGGTLHVPAPPEPSVEPVQPFVEPAQPPIAPPVPPPAPAPSPAPAPPFVPPSPAPVEAPPGPPPGDRGGMPAPPSLAPLPPPPHDPGESPAAPGRPKVNRTLLIVLGAVLVAAIVVVVVLLLTRSNDDSPATVEGFVAEQLNASDQNVESACGAIHSFASDRAGLVRLLDTMPVQARTSLVRTLRTQGGSWLPPESADWGYPEFRRGLLAVWDECARRGK